MHISAIEFFWDCCFLLSSRLSDSLSRFHFFRLLSAFWRAIAIEHDSKIAGTAGSLRNSSNPDGEDTRR